MRLTVKAKRVDSGGWISGWFTKSLKGSLFVPSVSRLREWDSGDFIECIEVDGSTICHHTGHPNNIFEGDYVALSGGSWGKVIWSNRELRWVIEESNRALEGNANWKPTGNNIHDTKDK